MPEKWTIQKLGEAFERFEKELHELKEGQRRLETGIKELREGQRELKRELKKELWELKLEIRDFKRWQQEIDEWRSHFSKEVSLIAGFIETKNKIRNKSIKPKLTFRKPHK